MVSTDSKQIRSRCRGQTRQKLRCKNRALPDESFCRIHRGPDGSLSYFRSMNELWARVEPQLKSLDPGDSGILGAKLHAAIVFADMCGFSVIGRDYEGHPHVSAFVGHHYLSLLENWGRTVRGINRVFIDKYVGDQIMLVIPGDRREATRVALELARIWCGLPGPYPSSIGVHWGEVWFGDVGLGKNGNRSEPFQSKTVMGQTVNIAARLCSEAAAGEVLLFGVTEPLEPITMVPIQADWTVDTRVANTALKNITDTPPVLCSLRHPPFLEHEWNLAELLEGVQADQPEFVVPILDEGWTDPGTG